MKSRFGVLTALVAAAIVTISAQTRPPGATFTGDAFRFNKIQEGIYHAVGTGTLSVGCNASIIVNDDDVLVVDSHSTPAAAWALQEQLKTITNKPIRFVINTHFHWDHAHGNQIYGPGVEVIGHDFTRQMLVSGASTSGRSYQMFIGGIPKQIELLKTQVAAAPAGEARTKLVDQLAFQEAYKEAQASVKPVPPSMTLSQSLTIYRGGREIRLLFLGRGHTGGDIVVYLPKERVVATGDLLVAGTSYLGDGYLTEWSATLDRLRELDFDVTLPGHGEAFRGKAKIDQFQSYLRDFWQQAEKLHAAGVSAEEAAKRIDLRSHAVDYPTIRDVGILDHGVYRAYDQIEGRVR